MWRFIRKAAIAMIVGAAIAFLPMPSRTLVLTLAVAYLTMHMRKRAYEEPNREVS